MAIEEYVPTKYINDSIPAINASNLNKTENGLKAVTDEVIAIGSVTPSGSVIAFAGSPAPMGYLECDGGEYSRDAYSKLFSAIGIVHGGGNGSTTFNVPDLRGEFIRGLDSGRGVDENRVLGSAQEDGLPEIEGEPFGSNFGIYGLMSPTGAFYAAGDTPRYNVDNDDNGDRQRLKFAASESNEIYGNSEGVQPRNIALMYIIKT